MTILTDDLKIFKSQTNDDTDFGGGRPTSNEVVDGLSNNLFNDTSALDRAFGDVSLRKIFPTVDTSTQDTYFGSQLIVSELPEDPLVNVTLFTTRDWFDRRSDARDFLESYLARGPLWPGHLLETQLFGQRVIQLALRTTDEEPKVGQGLVLVQFETLPSEYEQYVRVTKVTSVERVFTVGGKDVVRKVCTVDISDPLEFDFEGPSVPEFENGISPKAVCRDTRVANAAKYYGTQPLLQAAAQSDASVTAASIFTQLVPSAQAETPLIDLNAAALSSLFVPGNSTSITVTLNAPISSASKLYIGSAIVPGTLSMVAGANTITDVGADLKIGSTIVGFIEYDKGLCTFNVNVPGYSGNIVTTFVPAGVPTRVQDTASIGIIQNTRGYNYTITLLPIPQPGSLVVSYMAQGKVYFLYDKGAGVLKGSDLSVGTGNINYTTGSVILTTGALPDADSEIIFAWGKASTTFTRSGLSVAPARFEFTLANPGVATNSLTVSWGTGLGAKSATDNGNGFLTGDATGTINYATGRIKLIPNTLPSPGSEFSCDYQFGPPNEITVAAGVPVSGKVAITLPPTGGTSIIPKSLEVIWTPTTNTPGNLNELTTQQYASPPYYQMLGLASASR